MELEDLKSEYQNSGKDNLSKENIQKLVREKSHPVLKGIKMQLIIETGLWLIFLAVYYDFFDGHLRPLIWNILLVFSVVLILIHNILGYKITKNPIQGENILRSLENYLNRIRKYSVISIVTRVLAIGLILGYFISTIEMTPDKYWSLLFIALIFFVQVYLLQRVWGRRINKINMVYQKMKG